MSHSLEKRKRTTVSANTTLVIIPHLTEISIGSREANPKDRKRPCKDFSIKWSKEQSQDPFTFQKVSQG